MTVASLRRTSGHSRPSQARGRAVGVQYLSVQTRLVAVYRCKLITGPVLEPRGTALQLCSAPADLEVGRPLNPRGGKLPSCRALSAAPRCRLGGEA